jgi:hypothetical protein
VNRIRALASIYARIGRTYWAWRRSLLLLAVIVFVPVGLVDGIAIHTELGSIGVGNGFELAAVIGAVVALAVTGLLGEVFFSGAVAVSLTHPEHGKAPPLRKVASRLKYGRLIAVDLLYGLLVTVGLILLFAPGAAMFAWFGLAGPVVEIEGRSVHGAFARSLHLVRGRFWTVLLVLGPIELAGDTITDLIAGGVHNLIGDSLPASWLAESLANIALTPVFAVAAVLLTLDLIAAKDGEGPRLNPSPSAVPA